MSHILEALIVIAAYLMGSLSSAILLCRVAGLPDPRTEGSGNPGATNVLRFGGKRLAAMVFLGDMLKGLIPVSIATLLGLPPAILAATALAAFLGHVFPVFFGFKGGKGVATTIGVIAGLDPLLALILLLVWLTTAVATRYSSLSAILAALVAPFASWPLAHEPAFTTVIAAITMILLWRHRSNIGNLIAGKEPKIGKKP